MKKTVILTVVVVILALAAFGVGSVFAQGQQPPVWGMMGRGSGWMHDYVEQALAAKLGLPEKQVEDALASGKTMYQVALDAGTPEADVPALLTEVHKATLEKAVADGVLTQAQADGMLQRMQGSWANGGGFGNCPMHNGSGGLNNGAGFRGGMMGRWSNQ